MPDRLIKHGRLARSGIYQYADREIPYLGLPWPPPNDIGEKPFYNVLRPASVLTKAVNDGMFTRMPLTRGHPDEWVDPHNFKEFTVGYTGDKAVIEYLADIDEVAVTSSMVLAGAEAIDSYDRGVVDLSPGYSATFVWKKGELNGRSYDAVMTAVLETNHLALVNKGRGGSAASILDQEGSMKARKIASGLWWKVKRRFMVKDYATPEMAASYATGFNSALSSLIESRAAKKDDEITEGIDELKKLLKDLPDGDEKGLLMKYMDDMKLMKEEKDDVVREAQNLACSLFDKLDKHALSEEDIKMKDCAKCDGKGKIDGKDCAACDGTGKVKDEGLVAQGAKALTSAMEKSTNDAPPGTAPAKGDPPMDKPKDGVKDEPDLSVPAAVPPAPPATPVAQAVPQAPSPSPGGVPAAPAAAQGGPQFWMTKLAELLKGMMADPQIQAMMSPAAAPVAPVPAPAAPGAVPAAPHPASPAAPPPAAAPAAAPAPKPEGPPAEEKKEVPPPGGAKDSASSLTALIGSSDQGQEAGKSLDSIVDSIHGKKGK